jgi:sugar lactone lactonase YvrE
MNTNQMKLNRNLLIVILTFNFILITYSFSFAQTLIINTIAGNNAAGGGYSGDGGQATNAELQDPYGIAVDKVGNVYIADETNNVIRKVNTAGIITTIVGTGYGALTDTGGYNKPSGPGTTVDLYAPMGVAVDTLGNVYFCDMENNIVRKLLTTGIVITIAGNATATNEGTGGYSGDGGAATLAELNQPNYVAVDLAGNVFISDNLNNVVRKINTAGIISTFAGDTVGLWDGLSGGYSGDGGQATAAQLAGPSGIAIDKAGNVYIADLGNNAIRKINTAGIISTNAGNGTAGGYSGDGGQATSAQLSHPQDVAVDEGGNIYIADNRNNVIRKVNTLGIISTIVGNGYGATASFPNPTGGYSGDGGAATAAELWFPNGVAIDAVGNIYISDQHNNVIRKAYMGNPTGIEQYSTNNEQINIYPNPNNGSFVIEPNSTTKQTMQVYDVNGKLVLSQTINGKTTIDASSLNEGVYNISLQSNEGVVNKRLVIVR